MKDLKIKPGMDTPKAKLKNPTPKDADSLLKQHMDKRQREKEPESHDPVRYATDRVEKNMRRGTALAADRSQRMIKHYREKQQQGEVNTARECRATEPVDMGIGVENGSINAPAEHNFSPAQPAARNGVGKQTFSPKNANTAKSAMPPRRSEGGRKPCGTRKPPMGGTLPRKEQQSGTLYLHRPTVEVQ